MLIKCARFMWHRKYVDWSRRRFLGLPESGGGEEVDFANQRSTVCTMAITSASTSVRPARASQCVSMIGYGRMLARITCSASGSVSRGLASIRQCS